LLLIFMLTVVTSVSVVAYGVTHYTRAAFEEMDAQRTEALVAQFQKEFAQRGEEVVHQVENIANAEITLRMALDLARPNADQSLYVHDGTGAAQDHGLDFVQFVNSDGTLISSAQYPSRVGYKNEWVTANKNWRDSHSFLNKEELPDGVALSLTVVRTLPVGDKNFYIIGGRRLDQNFLASLVLPAGMRTLLYQNLESGFVPAELTDAGGAVQQPERYASLIEQSKQQPQRPVIGTINWSADPASAETFHAIPLTGRNDELLGILLVGSSRRELVLLTERIGWIAASVGAGALLIALLLTAGEAGYRIGRRSQSNTNEATKSHISVIQGTILGLLSLLLSFTLAMAVSRFDTRKQLVVDEANAIGTALVPRDGQISTSSPARKRFCTSLKTGRPVAISILVAQLTLTIGFAERSFPVWASST